MPYIEDVSGKKIKISADSISRYDSTSLTRSNIINNVTINNQSYLSPQYNGLNNPNEIAEFSSLSELEVEYESQDIFGNAAQPSDIVTNLYNGANQDGREEIRTVLSNITYPRPLNISGTISITNTQQGSTSGADLSNTLDLSIQALQNGASYTATINVDLYQFGTWYSTPFDVILEFSGTSLLFRIDFGNTAQNILYNNSNIITIGLEIDSIYQDVPVDSDSIFTIDGTYTYAIKEVTCRVNNNATIYEQPYDTNVGSSAGLRFSINYTKQGNIEIDEGTTDEELEQEYQELTYTALISRNSATNSKEFSSLAEFRTFCQAQLNSNNATIAFFGIQPTNVVENIFGVKKYRFFETFTLYFCWRIGGVENATTYDYNLQKGKLIFGVDAPTATNIEKSFYINEERNDQYSVESVYSGQYTKAIISGNYLIQDNTIINSEYAPIIMASNILNAFKNGRKVVSLTVFYGKYLDLDGNVVYNGTDGKYITVDDICVPYTIRNGIEVPLLTDKNGNAIEFRVTKSTLNYDGSATVSLTMLENT